MVLLCERHCVPARPCWPPVLPTSRALPPLRSLPVCPPVLLFFFFGVPAFALSAAPARPACAPCSSPCYPCSAAPRPLTHPSPLPFSFSQSTLPVRLPSLSEPRCHPCVPPACSTPAPLRRPYPFPWGFLHPSVPSVPVSHPILVALCPVWGGEGVSADWIVALPKDWHGRCVPTHHEPPHSPKEHRENDSESLSNSLRCICTVEPSRIDQLRRLYRAIPIGPEPPVGPDVVTKGSHFVAPRRCPMAPMATKGWRGQPLRAGHA